MKSETNTTSLKSNYTPIKFQTGETTMRYHLYSLDFYQKTENNKLDSGEKLEPLYLVGGNANRCSHCGKQSGVFMHQNEN